ncbi:hypothetical protein THAOC_00187 [Thalassiosira oceanica]|uniref:Sulfotransferase domain-containing protein n=1 Tax=Thalassiosira oceanica TaxID=159749 RepID=K0TGR1_THAOC|nr:hypothetical protein THAOC_00187 [Thalassiosira oceanica]|eukprot:EJK77943.1 hypothetical protein THAOC_00187 [Thalassiosira oceanica]
MRENGRIVAVILFVSLDMFLLWSAIESIEGDYHSSRPAARLPVVPSIRPEQMLAFSTLRTAGVALPSSQQLPTRSDISSQYGDTPVGSNDEACQEYRRLVPKSQRFLAVAGLFNTGTHLLGNLLVRNCQIDGHVKGTGMRMVVPWGKHNPPLTHRLRNVAKVGGKGVNQTSVLPVVVVKDPYHCSHWLHDSDHCPAIVNWNTIAPNAVTVKYALDFKNYKSHIEFWNEWNREYINASFPAIFVRFEDLLFDAERAITGLCKCVEGRRRRGGFRYVEESAKNSSTVSHQGANGLLSAIMRYGNPQKRLEGWTKEDWIYARDHLDWEIMARFKYSLPKWPGVQ